MALPQQRETIKAAHAGKVEIQQDQMDVRIRFAPGEGFVASGRLQQFQCPVQPLQQQLDTFAKQLVIIHEKNLHVAGSAERGALAASFSAVGPAHWLRPTVADIIAASRP